jgi:hypothetical protein
MSFTRNFTNLAVVDTNLSRQRVTACVGVAASELGLGPVLLQAEILVSDFFREQWI